MDTTVGESLSRRRLLGLAGLGVAGGTAWDVFRDGDDVSVTEPPTRPDATESDIATYVRGCTDFGVDLLRQLADTDRWTNLAFSPVSLSSSLAMAWAGAAGETKRAMRRALRFPDGPNRVHRAIGALSYDIARRERNIQHRNFPELWQTNRFDLGLTNAVWAQAGYPFDDSVLDLLSRYYGSTIRSVDFDSDPDGARTRINRWARQASSGLVENAFPPDAITKLTRLFVTNVVLLRADWKHPFDPEETESGEFTRPDGSTVSVPMMTQVGSFPFLWRSEANAEIDTGFRMVELPYIGGDLSMVLVVPTYDTSLRSLVRAIDATWLHARFDELDSTDVRVTMPRVTFGNELELADQLAALGMESAFHPRDADFSGMTDPPSAGEDLYIASVVHDTHLTIDEEGTTAVAVTGLGMETQSIPPSIELDRPYLFCIRDRPTDTVLFMGQVTDPTVS